MPDVRCGPVVSVCSARFLAGICCCFVGAGLVVSSAMEAVEVEFAMIFSDVSICHTRTPPRTICCSLLFLFFLGPVVVLVSMCLFFC